MLSCFCLKALKLPNGVEGTVCGWNFPGLIHPTWAWLWVCMVVNYHLKTLEWQKATQSLHFVCLPLGSCQNPSSRDKEKAKSKGDTTNTVYPSNRKPSSPPNPSWVLQFWCTQKSFLHTDTETAQLKRFLDSILVLVMSCNEPCKL